MTPVRLKIAGGSEILVNPDHVAMVWPVPEGRCSLEFPAGFNTEGNPRSVVVEHTMADLELLLALP